MHKYHFIVCGLFEADRIVEINCICCEICMYRDEEKFASHSYMKS